MSSIVSRSCAPAFCIVSTCSVISFSIKWSNSPLAACSMSHETLWTGLVTIFLPSHRRKGILRPLCDLERLVCRLRESTHSCRSNQRQAQVESRSLPQLSSSSHDQLERLQNFPQEIGKYSALPRSDRVP